MDINHQQNNHKGSLVIISSIHWHFTWQRHHEMALNMSQRGYKVLFIEPIPKRWPGIREWKRVIGRMFGDSKMSGYAVQEIPPEITMVTPLAIPDVDTLSRKINGFIFIPMIVRKIEKYELPRPLVILNYLPTSASLNLQRKLNADIKIYDCVLDWTLDPYSKGLATFENTLLKEVDAVITDSPYLFFRMQKEHKFVTQILPGVHPEKFYLKKHSYSENEQIRCAYFGSIGVSVDINLLRKVSQHCFLRLIGPIQVELTNFSPNVEIIGAVRYEEVPDYLDDIDVLLLPYKYSPHMPAVIPAKTFECLATGKPTIAIGLSSLDEYNEYFYICKNEAEVLHAISLAVKEDPSKRMQRINFANKQKWDSRINQLENIINSLLGQDNKDKNLSDSFETGL